jgi:hypothetical protein
MKGRLSLEPSPKPSPLMGEGWEGVMLPAAQEASASLRTASTKRPGNCSEKIRNRAPGEAGLAQYRTNHSGREIVPMNGHDRLAAGSSRCRRIQCEPLVLITSKPARSAAAMTMRPEGRGQIPVGGRNGLAILPHHLQAQLDRLAHIRLRFFQGFAIGNYRGQLGAGDREPTIGLGPEAAEISDKRLPT